MSKYISSVDLIFFSKYPNVIIVSGINFYTITFFSIGRLKLEVFFMEFICVKMFILVSYAGNYRCNQFSLVFIFAFNLLPLQLRVGEYFLQILDTIVEIISPLKKKDSQSKRGTLYDQGS